MLLEEGACRQKPTCRVEKGDARVHACVECCLDALGLPVCSTEWATEPSVSQSCQVLFQSRLQASTGQAWHHPR